MNALSNLTITLPHTAVGSADVVVALIGPDGAVLAETTFVLVITPVPAAPSLAPAPAPDDRRRALQLLQKGHDQLAQGLVAAARQLYERAADMGVAQAAMALAGTYDVEELAGPRLQGVQPDAQEARRWYERARALGAPDAEQRLRRLERN